MGAEKKLSKHSHFRAAKVQTSMHKGADLQEPSPHETDGFDWPFMPTYNKLFALIMNM